MAAEARKKEKRWRRKEKKTFFVLLFAARASPLQARVSQTDAVARVDT